MEIALFIIIMIFLPLIIGTLVMGWQKKIKIRHKGSGLNGTCFVGYFVPIFRGEISIGVFHLIFSLVTFGIFQLIMPFLYNRQYSARLLTSDWVLDDIEENNLLARDKIGISKN